jgi:hypothetical protein
MTVGPPADLVQVAAMMLAVAITSTGRPFLTLLLLVGVPTLLIDTNWWAPSDWYLPKAQLWMVAGLLVLAVMEHVARSRALYAEAIERLPWDRLMVNVIVWLLYVWGVTHTMEGAPLAAPAAPDLGEISKVDYVELAKTLAPQSLLLVGSLSINTGAAFARRSALDLLRSFGMGGIAHWLESFGVIGVVLVAVFLPVAALLLAALALAPVIFVVAAAKMVERRIDQDRRRPCPSCGHSVRVEASLCPDCWTEIPIARPLVN